MPGGESCSRWSLHSFASSVPRLRLSRVDTPQSGSPPVFYSADKGSGNSLPTQWTHFIYLMCLLSEFIVSTSLKGGEAFPLRCPARQPRCLIHVHGHQYWPNGQVPSVVRHKGSPRHRSLVCPTKDLITSLPAAHGGFACLNASSQRVDLLFWEETLHRGSSQPFGNPEMKTHCSPWLPRCRRIKIRRENTGSVGSPVSGHGRIAPSLCIGFLVSGWREQRENCCDVRRLKPEQSVDPQDTGGASRGLVQRKQLSRHHSFDSH